MTCIIPKHIFNQFLAAITAFMALFSSGMWSGWMSNALPKLEAGETSIRMTSDDLSWLVSLLDVGNLLSPIPIGYLVDRFGRLFSLRLASVIFFLASVFTLFASAPYQLFLSRLLAGMGKGVGYTTSSLYVAEVAEPRLRGRLCGILGILSLGGSVFTMTVGPFVSLRSLKWVTIIFPTAGFLLTFCIVESPYFFFIRNDLESATKAFNQVRDSKKLKSNQTELEVIRKKVEEDMRGPKRFSSLILEKGNRRALMIVLATGMMERSGGISCLQDYASTTLPTDSFWDPAISVMIFSWVTLASTILEMSLVDLIGRKPLQLISTFGMCLTMGVLTAFYYFYEHQQTEVNVSRFTFVPHVGIQFYALFYAFGAGPIPHLFQSELFPTCIKSRASAMMTIALAVGAFMTTKIYLAVEKYVGVYFMYFIFTVSNFANFVFSHMYIFETKGKTLAELQDLLNK